MRHALSLFNTQSGWRVSHATGDADATLLYGVFEHAQGSHATEIFCTLYVHINMETPHKQTVYNIIIRMGNGETQYADTLFLTKKEASRLSMIVNKSILNASYHSQHTSITSEPHSCLWICLATVSWTWWIWQRRHVALDVLHHLLFAYVRR